MKLCGCGKPKGKHHPSLHYAKKRDALMRRVDKFMDEVYPADIFVSPFTRKMTACIAACFVLDKIEKFSINGEEE